MDLNKLAEQFRTMEMPDSVKACLELHKALKYVPEDALIPDCLSCHIFAGWISKGCPDHTIRLTDFGVEVY